MGLVAMKLLSRPLVFPSRKVLFAEEVSFHSFRDRRNNPLSTFRFGRDSSVFPFVLFIFGFALGPPPLVP